MPAQILVVDDEPDLELLIRQRFRRHIRDQEWHFVFARNGVEALALVRADPEIDLVLTDINMPEMDGLTLLEQLLTLNPVLRAIIITAYGDTRNIRKAMQCGAYDFLTKPLNWQDLEITIGRALQHVRQYLRHVARLTDAAAAIENGSFDPVSLKDVVRSGGELGRLARVLRAMAHEVQVREQSLQRQVQTLWCIEIDQARKARQVAAVTESEYFCRLQREAQTSRARAATQRGVGV